MAASIDAVLNLVIGGSSRIDQLINKINQLDGVISAISKTPIDLSVSAAEAEIKRFNNSVLAIGKSLKTAEKSFDDAQKRLDRFQKAFDAANRAVSTSNPNTKKYDQAVERRRKAAEELISALAELKEAEEAINKIDSSGALKNAENRKKEAQEAAKLTKEINALAEQYLKYGEAQKRAAGGQFAGPAPKSIAQLNAQAQALSLVASNTEVATAAFNRFVIASEIAGQKTYYAQQEQLKALAAGLSKEAPQVSFGGKSIAAARNQVKEFVDSYATLLKSEASMSAFVAQAQKLKSLLPDTVEEFTMLEKVISKASEDIRSIGALGKIKVQIDIDQERFDRLNQLARRRGAPEAYAIQAGPLPEGERGGARYFAERAEIAEELLKIEKEIIAVQKEFADVRSAEDKKAEESAKRRLEIYKNIKKTISNAGDVIFDATTFGKSAEIKKTIGDITRGARNALVRGGLGLGALGAGGLYEGIGNLANVDLGGISWGKLNVDFNVIKGPIGAAAKAISEPINNALQGIPEIIGNFLSALGDIPGALGIAAVAAYALAPAMKTAGEAVYEAGKKFGESDFGQNIKLTLSRQTNIFEEVINAASEMNMTLDASKSGLDAVGQAVRSLPALPAAGETSFRGAIRQVADRETLLAIEEAKALNKAYAGGITTTFMGGGARRLLNRDYLSNLEDINGETRTLVSRSDEAAQATLMFAEKLSDAADDLETAREATFKLNQEIAEAKAAFERFKLDTFAENANAYSRAVLNINQAFRDYVAAGGKGLDITTQQSQAYIDAAQSAKEYAKSVNAAAGRGYEGIESPAERLRKIQQAQESMGLQPVQAPSLALRPAGYTDEDVRIKNLLDNVAQYEQKLDKIVSDGELELLQIQLNYELDNIDKVLTARNAAGEAWWAAEKKRLDSLPDIADVRRRPISFMTPQERGVLPTEEGGITLAAGNILDPASLRADRRRRIQSLRERKDARGRALSEGLIGGAFPLLFGQGVGASLGGLAGGVGGGLAGGGLGFGLSLIGTALGTALDQLGAAAAEAGKALRDPIAGFEKLKEANLLASKAQEFYIQKLIESGRVTQASAVIQSEIIKKIGVTGVNDLNKLGESSSKLSKVWAEFNLQLQAAVAGPLAKLLDWITEILALSNAASASEQRAKDVSSGLTGDVRRRFDDELSRIAISQATYGKFGSLFGAISPAEANRQRNALSDLYEPFSQPPTPRKTAIDPVQQEAAIKAAQQAADEIKQAYREGFKLQQQAIDLERQAADFRKRIADDIFNKQQEVLRAQVETDRLSADARIKAVDLEYQKRINQEEGRVAQLLEAEAELIRVKAAGQADIDSKRQLLELDIAKQERDTQNYIRSINTEVNNIRRQTLQYEMDVQDSREASERRIAELRRIDQMGAATGSMPTGPGGRQYYGPGGAPTGPAGFVQSRGSYTSSSVDGFPITSRPGLRWGRMHRGVDIGTPMGTALGYEVGGEVLSATTLDGYGKVLEVKLENGVTAFAAHLNEVLVKAGDRFTANQILARTGQTGRGTGPHLHMEGVRGGDPYSPLPYLQLGSMQAGSQVRQMQQAQSQIRPVNIPMVDTAAAGQQMTELNRQDEQLRRRSLDLSQQILNLDKQSALEKITSVARGAKDLDQRKYQLNLLGLQIKQTTGLKDEDRERGILAAEYLADVQRTADANATFIQQTRLDSTEKQAVLEAFEAGFKIRKEQYDLDVKILGIARMEAAARGGREAVAAFVEQNKQLDLEIQKRQLRLKLITEGSSSQKIETEMRVFELQNKLTESLDKLNKETNDAIRAEAARLGINADMITSTFKLTEATLESLLATEQDTKKKEEYRKELERILALRKALEGDATSGTQDAIDKARGATTEIPGEKIGEAYKAAKDRLDELINKENQAIFVAQTIGDAFGQAFREIAAGTATAQEILSGFFQSLANSFADMAAQIIAEMIKMYILKQLLNLFGAAGGGAGGAAGAAASGSTGLGKTLEGIASYGYANGGVFANSIKPFAMGGVVNSPTLFKFANGGAMNTGVMGEAGPEAILPLSRGSDGKLGVSASGSGGDVNVTVNVDAKGTSVQGNDQSGNQLGRAISAAVQQEIIKQRRPGGLLNK